MDKEYEIRVGFETGKSLFTFKTQESMEVAFAKIEQGMREKGIARFNNEAGDSEVLLDCTKVILAFTGEYKGNDEEEDYDDEDDDSTEFSASEDIINFFKNGGNCE